MVGDLVAGVVTALVGLAVNRAFGWVTHQRPPSAPRTVAWLIASALLFGIAIGHLPEYVLPFVGAGAALAYDAICDDDDHRNGRRKLDAAWRKAKAYLAVGTPARRAEGRA